MTLCWSTTGWNSPPKTGTTTTQRTTAPPSTMVPGGTATATRPTWTASTCAVSTPPTPMASSGPLGLGGSTPSSSRRWRFDQLAIQRVNESSKRSIRAEDGSNFLLKYYKPQLLTARRSYLCCLFTETYLFGFSGLYTSPPWCLSLSFAVVFLHHSATACQAGYCPSPGPSLCPSNVTLVPLFFITQFTKSNSEPTV